MLISVGLLVTGYDLIGVVVETKLVGTFVGAMLNSIGFILGASVKGVSFAAIGFILGVSVSAAMSFILGALVTGLSVILWSVGTSVGGGDGCGVGFGVVGLRVGLGVSFGAGRHGVNEKHIMPSDLMVASCFESVEYVRPMAN